MTGRDDRRTGYLVRNAPIDVVQVRTTRPPPRASVPPPIPPDATSRASGLRPRARTEPHGMGVGPASSLPPAFDSAPRTEPCPPPTFAATDTANALVQELMAALPGEEHAFVSRLFALRHVGLTALHDHFPGPLWCDPRRPFVRLPRARQLSAIASCLVSFGDLAVPYVTSLLDAPHPDVRLFAVVAARDLPYGTMLDALTRLAIEGDPIARKATLEVLPEFAALQGYPTSLARFRAILTERSTQQSFRLRAIQCAEELRDAAAVPSLIEVLGESDRELARAAHAALRRLTGHDLGSMRFAWNRFLRAFAGRPRFVWLLEGLVDRRIELRTIAATELSRLTGHAAPLGAEASREDALQLRASYEIYWANVTRVLSARD